MSTIFLRETEAITDAPRPPRGSGWELEHRTGKEWYWKRRKPGKDKGEELQALAEKWRARGLGLTEAVEDLGDLAASGPRRELSQSAYAEALAYVLVHLDRMERSKL